MKLERKKVIQIVCVVLLIYLIMRYWAYLAAGAVILLNVLMPLIAGGAIAYVVNIVMEFYENKFLSKIKFLSNIKGKRIISIIMAYGSIFLVTGMILVLVVPELNSCVEVLVASLPEMFDKLEEFMHNNYEKIEPFIKDFNPDTMNWEKIVNDTLSWSRTGFSSTIGVVMGYVSSIFSVIVNFVMGLIFSIYILADKEHLKGQVQKLINTYLSSDICNKIYYVTSILNDSFHNFIVGQCIEAVILGVLCVAGMLLFQFPYAVMIGILIGCTALVPIAGAYIGGAVGVVMIFTESPVKAVMFVVFLVILQQFEDQIIYPKVVGSSIGLPGIWVFAAVIVGGGLFGIPGTLFGIPIVSTIYKLILNDVRKKSAIKEQEKESKDEDK